MKKKLVKAAMRAAPTLNTRTLRRATHWVEDRVMPRRRSSMGTTAAKGLGAAAIALPLGLWIGRRLLGSREE